MNRLITFKTLPSLDDSPLPSFRFVIPMTILVLLVLMLSNSVGAVPAPALAQAQSSENQFDESEKQLVQGLRRRRLFALADSHCLRLLASKKATVVDQMTLTTERIRTQTSKAVVTSQDVRDVQWQAVDLIVEEFAKTYPRHPQAMLVNVQLAMSKLARARLLQQEIKAEMSLPGARETAIQSLTQARSILTKLEVEAKKQFESQRNQTLAPNAISQEQLQTLGSNVRYQLAKANLVAAQLYPEDDDLNRIASLNEVLRRLGEVQRETSETKFLWWQTKVDELACLRLLNRIEPAAKLSVSLNREGRPAAIEGPLFEQDVLIGLTSSNAALLKKMWDHSKKFATRSPSLELVRVRLLMGLASSSQGQEKEKWIQTASALAKNISQEHGGYWGRRAELVLIGTSSGGGSAGLANGTISAGGIDKGNGNGGLATTATQTEVDMIGRIADQAKRKGNLDDALKGYLRAAEKAVAIGQPKASMVFNVRASQVLESQKKHAEAAKVLTTAAVANPAIAMSPSVHLRGCWNFGQAVKSAAAGSPVGSASDVQNLFIEQLNSHLKTWPQSATNDQARYWLAAQYQSQMKWNDAVETYLQIASTSRHFESGSDNARRCAIAALNEMEKGGGAATAEIRAMAKQLVKEFQQVLDGTNSQMGNTAGSKGAVSLVVAISQIGIGYDVQRPEDTIEALKTAMAKRPADQASQKETLSHWLAVAEATRSSSAAANEAFATTRATSSSLAKELSAAISRGTKHLILRKGNVEPLQSIQLAIAERQLAGETSPQEKLRWEVERAKSLGGLDRFDESIKLFQSLVAQSPRDGSIQVAFAEVLVMDRRPESLSLGLSQWRKIANRSKPQTELWFRAKYSVASLLVETGKKDEASKLLKYMKAIPPGWEKSSLKDKFESLLRKSN